MVKNRHKILLGIIVSLIIWITIDGILPVGSGNWNGKQIDRIRSVGGSSRFCFAVMGDNKNGFGTFQGIIRDINRREPLFALDIGDLVFDGEKEKYRIFYGQIQKSKVPFLVAVGNHDIREGGRTNYFNIFGDFYYSFSYGNSLFIVLDDANEKYLDKQQMEFLKSELARNFEHKFVFMHVPPFDPRAFNINVPGIIHKEIKPEHCLSNHKNARKFMNLVSRYKVAAVFNSHIHGYFSEKENGVNYIITGGAGAEMFFSDPQHYFYHYVQACVDGDRVSYEVIKFHSPDFNKIDRFSYVAWLYFWYFVISHKITIILSLVILVLVLDLAHWRLGALKRWLETKLRRPY